METNEIQDMINKTDYWDMRVLGLTSIFYGDEIYLFIENDKNSCWKFIFSICHKVFYETDADRRNIHKVRNMTRGQLGYYCQDISVCKSETNGFCDVSIDLSIMNMKIICKEIEIEKVQNKEIKLQTKY